MIKHAARWRVRSFAALWIRTGPEGAQLRVWVQRQVICRESVGSLHVRFLSSKILGGNRGQAELRSWDRATLEMAQDAPKTPQVDLLFFITFSMPFGIDFCSIFDPNLPPKIHQNRSKIDAKMPSHVELLF